MGKIENFKEQLINGYATSGDAITIGAAKFENEPQKEVQIKIPLKILNRHGLIAGATGTGKTVTLQIIAENMCNAGIPVLLMDLKGDLSGISKALKNQDQNRKKKKLFLKKLLKTRWLGK